ncbi:MAG: hypothetical protein HY791_24620 [Deltaproteobacteria bacterium]|nr:hypothetical protein [Deltaproteobacteria bacterium]
MHSGSRALWIASVAACIASYPEQSSADAPEDVTSLALIFRIHGFDPELTSRLLGVGLRVVSFFPAATVEQADEELASQAKQCRKGTDCLADLLASRRLDGFLILTVDKDAALVSAQLRMAREAQAEPSLADMTAAPEQAIEQVLRDALGRAGFTAGGRLTFEFIPPDAELQVLSSNGRVASRERSSVLQPGHYSVEVEHDGYDAEEVEVLVEPFRETHFFVKLDSSPPFVLRPWFLVGAGVIAVVAVGAYWATSSASVRFSYSPTGSGLE